MSARSLTVKEIDTIQNIIKSQVSVLKDKNLEITVIHIPNVKGIPKVSFLCIFVTNNRQYAASFFLHGPKIAPVPADWVDKFLVESKAEVPRESSALDFPTRESLGIPKGNYSSFLKLEGTGEDGQVRYGVVDELNPIINCTSLYELKKPELKRLKGAIGKPESVKVFGGILKKILESVGYTVRIKTKPLATFPIVKVDRTTLQDLLPVFINKGIFTNYTNLPTEAEILNRAKKRLRKPDLEFKERRDALSKAGEYRTPRYVMRDYGDYAIGFSAKLYIDYLDHSEEDLMQAWTQPSLFDNENKAIEEALRNIRLYKLAHKLSLISLAEIYAQKTYKGVVIPKRKIVEYLGYNPEDKYIYQEIKDAYLSLRWLDYKIFDYSYTERERKKARGKAVGNFIYNFEETQKHYTLDVNEKFVGCVAYLWGEKIQGQKERKRLLGRGYINYVTSALSLSRDYSTPAYLLQDFLIRDSGNRHHNKTGLKAVVYNGVRFVEECHITHTRANRRWRTLLNAIKEVEIIKRLEPPLADLHLLKPSTGLKTKIIMYVKRTAKALDQDIQKMLKQKIK